MAALNAVSGCLVVSTSQKRALLVFRLPILANSKTQNSLAPHPRQPETKFNAAQNHPQSFVAPPHSTTPVSFSLRNPALCPFSGCLVPQKRAIA
ncbi:hypothetical protein [Kingella sp. (in: b-proteobacteria)]|uniref:hypothetical protein n=1 Tax=Kingella sp. (in: b-proteobacteria) TaxID=2020713 RepID=UPI0026DD99C5|nr:hypothetical protein [Kingella sp. (in: b-proteobacteria)]MDO4657626.1 hypothetical protein [Kingella sp. (in: b-proteobacteria)]